MKELRLVVIGALLGAGLMVPLAFFHDQRQNAKIDSLESVVEQAQAVRAAAIESVTVYVPVVAKAQAESDRLARVVQLAGPTSVAIYTTPSVAPVVYTVPAEVVAKMRADSITIAEQAAQLLRKDSVIAADSTVIDTQSAAIAELKKGQRCGAKCGALVTLSGLAVLKLVASVVM